MTSMLYSVTTSYYHNIVNNTVAKKLTRHWLDTDSNAVAGFTDEREMQKPLTW